MSSASSCPAVYAGLLGREAGMISTAGHAIAAESGLGLMRLFVNCCFVGAAVAGITAVILSVSLAVGKRREREEAEEETPNLRALTDAHLEAGFADFADENDGVQEPVLAQAKESVESQNVPSFIANSAPVAAAQPRSGARHMKPAEKPTHVVAEKVKQQIPSLKSTVSHKAQTTTSDGLFDYTGYDLTGDHAASDYGDIAENYVRKQTLRERMAARASGVASVLAERLGREDMFDDLPVIARADGSVGDVGTSWWDNRLGKSVRRTGAIMDDTEPRLGETNGGSSLEMAAQYAELGSTGSSMPSYAQARAQAISRSISPVETGLYPEMRDASELDGDDLWDVALRAMSERIAAQSARPVFNDAVGGSDTLDEPEDLEGPTGFIPFKRPTGHPEVVDTQTYVEYLIGEEFEQNNSEAAKKTSRDYLRVIRGGSQKSRPLDVPRQKKAYTPKHFAPAREPMPLLAKEA